jgi:hypothetical protein
MEQVVDQVTPLGLFKKRVYDILSNRDKFEPMSVVVGELSGLDSSVLTAIGLAADKMLEDAALELAEAAFDAMALTMLQIYKNGMPAGAQMANANMQQLAEILDRAGERPEDKEAD